MSFYKYQPLDEENDGLKEGGQIHTVHEIAPRPNSITTHAQKQLEVASWTSNGKSKPDGNIACINLQDADHIQDSANKYEPIHNSQQMHAHPCVAAAATLVFTSSEPT